jgi:predicted 3-demethylubiquinone-9 3-methyltransferase (glyoxalase superfamily)
MQKIQPFLWFNANAEEAAKLYISLFKNSKITSTMPGAPGQPPMVVSCELEGKVFNFLNGGPQYHPSQSISFTVYCETETEIDSIWKGLAGGGKVHMDLANYPWAKKYGWIEDKFGVNWQLTLSEEKKPITPSFLFSGKNQGRAEEAINYWTAEFPNSSIDFIARYEEGEPAPKGQIKFASFTLAGMNFIAMDSGHPMDVPFTEGVSLLVNCENQNEVDKYWNDFTKEGEESMCGWLRDKFGVSWQIIPTILMKLNSDKDREKAGRVFQAMLGMKKIVIADLEAAYAGETEVVN